MRPGYFLTGGGSGGGGPSTLLSGSTIWVDDTSGDDTTAATSVYDQFKPFLTLTAALASASTGDTIRARGTFAESVTVPAGCLLVGDSHDGIMGAKITGALATGHRVTLGNGSAVQDFVIDAPTDATACVYAPNAVAARVDTSTFVGKGSSGLGALNEGTGELDLNYCSHIGGTLDAVVKTTGTLCVVTSLHCDSGTTTDILENAGTGEIEAIDCFVNPNYVSTNGVSLIASSTVKIENSTFQNCTNGVHITGDSAYFDGANITFEGCTFDLLVDSGLTTTQKLTLSNSHASRSKISVPTAVKNSGRYMLSIFDVVDGDEAVRIFGGELAVGDYQRGSEFIAGEGDSHTGDMVVLTNDNLEAGTWNDITTDAVSASGSTFAPFPGITAGNTLYIGGDVDFPTVKIDVNTALVIGSGEFVWEYWNGSAWTEFFIMVTQSNNPYAQKAQRFAQQVESQQLRMSAHTGDAQKTLDGNLKYWVRCRISTAITSVGLWEQIKLGTNRFEINADGHNEMFGAAQTPHLINSWEPKLVTEISGATIGDQSLNINTGFVLLATDNKFANNATDAVSFKIRVSHGVDTSKPFTVITRWYPSSTDTGSCDIEWDYATLAVGTVLDGTVTVTNETQSLTPGGTAEAIQEFSKDFYFPDAETNDIIWVKLSRPTGDAFTGDMILVDTFCENAIWT